MDRCSIERYEQLVNEIESTNQAWHSIQELFGGESSFSQTARFLKGRLQIRLLRNFPKQAYLEIDPNADGEEQYGVRLKIPVNGRTDAMHIPVRVVNEWLKEGIISPEELNTWLNNKGE